MTSAANQIQHGGDHYAAVGLQHWDLCEMYGIGYLESAATKYLYRWRNKNGLEDLMKALHYTQKLIELARDGWVVQRPWGKRRVYRLPRGSVPRAVLRDWYAENKVPMEEATACTHLFNWKDHHDLRRAENVILAIIMQNFPGTQI